MQFGCKLGGLPDIPFVLQVCIRPTVKYREFEMKSKICKATRLIWILSRTSNSLFFDFISNGYKKPANSQFLEYELAG